MENPYQTTESVLNHEDNLNPRIGEKLEATSVAQAALYSSKGWVKFVGVLGFIYFAFMVIAVFMMMFVLGHIGGGGSIIMFLLMLAMTIVVFMLALRLSKFSNAISRMEVSRSPVDLENAMIEQMKFWRIAGILVLIGLVITVLTLIAPTAFAGF